tara:strand:+ start:562 stop:960 length:399 start_codon:yes stop_codon:yes gene_type:complete
MATNANWTIIFEDKKIIKQSGDAAGTSYNIEDNDFWNDSKFSNIWAIQHGTSNTSDEVEHRDETPHCSYEDANLGDISQFSDRWDAAHLAQLQADWDLDNLWKTEADGSKTLDETPEEKIVRLGARPTSYSS